MSDPRDAVVEAARWLVAWGHTSAGITGGSRKRRAGWHEAQAFTRLRRALAALSDPSPSPGNEGARVHNPSNPTWQPGMGSTVDPGDLPCPHGYFRAANCAQCYPPRASVQGAEGEGKP